MCSETKRICFLGFGTYPILTKKQQYDAGGAELQQVLIAQELVSTGYEVTIIDFDYDQGSVEEIDGIKVIKTFKPKNKTSIVDYLVNIPKIISALNRSDAEIYYHRSGILFIPLLFSKIRRKKFLYSVAHDTMVERTKGKSVNIKYLLKRLDIYLNIRRADMVLAQSVYQQKLIYQNHSKRSIVVKNIYDVRVRTIDKDVEPLVLWVATLRDWKRPEIFVELSKKFPRVRFCMIGGPSENAMLYESTRSASKSLPNFEFMGFVPLHEIEMYFEKAWIFVNTSEKEGFPNTFLQAWANYTPVVSLDVDPDEIICEHQLGFHSKTFNQMVLDIEFLLNNNGLRKEYGVNGYNYITQNHNARNIVEKYDEIFKTIYCSE